MGFSAFRGCGARSVATADVRKQGARWLRSGDARAAALDARCSLHAAGFGGCCLALGSALRTAVAHGGGARCIRNRPNRGRRCSIVKGWYNMVQHGTRVVQLWYSMVQHGTAWCKGGTAWYKRYKGSGITMVPHGTRVVQHGTAWYKGATAWYNHGAAWYKHGTRVV